MFNSKELCQPLFYPFDCFALDTEKNSYPEDERVHYYVEIMHIRTGSVNVTYNRETHTISAGETIIICPGVPHSVTVTEASSMDVIRSDPDRMTDPSVYMTGFRRIFHDAARKHLPMIASAEDSRKYGFHHLCRRCVEEFEAREYGYDSIIAGILTIIYTQGLRFWSDHGFRLSKHIIEPDVILTLPGYIQDHLQDSPRVEDLAAYCGLSYPWFAKKFREIYDISCKEYIERIRVTRVEQYLRFTDMDLHQISRLTGYADTSHMIKNFKRIMNTTPGQFRIRNR